MLRRSRILIAIGSVTLAGGLAVAGPGGAGRGHRGFEAFSIDKMQDKLGLTEAQASELRSIQDTQLEARFEIDGKLEYLHHELGELMRSDEPDRSAIHAKVDEISSLRAEQMKLGIDARLAGRKVLTAEQRAQAEELREGRRERMMERRRHRGDRDESPVLENEQPR